MNFSRHAHTITFTLVTAIAIPLFAPLSAQAPVYVPDGAPARIHPLPTLREQAEEIREWNRIRLETVLPGLMREYGVDMWVLSMREYAEDPVFWSFKDATTFAARRRSIYVFYDRGPEEGVERLALGGTSQGGLFRAFRSTRPADPGASGRSAGELVGNEQWQLFHELVKDRDPARIVLNIDGVQAFSDGLHSGERELLEQALGPVYRERVVREPRLAMNFIGLRIPEMMPRYRKIEETVHAIISQAFSNAVIEPGVTTTDAVRWWLREKVQELGMTVWFHPSVGIMGRPGGVDSASGVIQRGDVLWTDFGVIALGLKTDTQHLGYVLLEGETEPPAGVLRCLANSNRLQDILLEKMEPGLTGNQILSNALAQMRSEGINGTIYTHPIGDHGHGAGPLIGRWDEQERVDGRGDPVLLPSTWHSIELQSTNPVPEFGEGQTVSCRQEEEAYLDESGDRHWVYRRQSRFHLVW